MQNLTINPVLFLELKLIENASLDSEDFNEIYGVFFKSAYKLLEEQIAEAWSVGYQQALADDNRNNQVSDFIDFDHFIKKTYGSI
jgi:hypothetical protein